MANEKYFVLWDFQGSGDATAGYVWENKPSGAAGGTVAIGRGPVETAKIVEVSPKAAAESLTAQEAVTAVRRAYGDGMISGPMKVILNTNVEEKSAL